jgi:hypothetical protein
MAELAKFQNAIDEVRNCVEALKQQVGDDGASFIKANQYFTEAEKYFNEAKKNPALWSQSSDKA